MNGVLMLFGIYDEKAEAFMPPFVAPTKAHAIRTVADMTTDRESMVARHPGDFSLFCLGAMDQRTGEILPEKVNLGNCVEFRASVFGERLEEMSKEEGAA